MITRNQFNDGYQRVSQIHVCVRCNGNYIKTMGEKQRVCLICKRDEDNHNYTNVNYPKPGEFEAMGESYYAVLFDTN